MAAQHFLTEDKQGSFCTVTGDTDVFAYGSDTGPTTYCTACREAEPEWIHLEDEEYRRMIL